MEDTSNERKTECCDAEESKLMLFTTKICPSCPKAKEELKDINEIEHIDAHENMELSQKYGVRAVPTLVIVKGGQHKNYSGIQDIIKYKSELQKKDA